MVFNLILAVTILKEKFSRWDFLATVLVSAGSISCMLLSKQRDDVLTTQEIGSLFLSLGSLFFFGLGLVFLVYSHLLNRSFRRSVDQEWFKVINVFFKNNSSASVTPGEAAGINVNSGSVLTATDYGSLLADPRQPALNSKTKNVIVIFTYLNDDQRKLLKLSSKVTPARLKVPLVILTTAAGLLASFSIIFIKGMTSSFEAAGFAFWALYLFVALLITSALQQLRFINLSMEIYDQVDTIPIF